jgi:hypothetical protein
MDWGGALVLSQTSDEDKRDFHFLLSSRSKYRTALLAFGTQFRWLTVVPCEWRA